MKFISRFLYHATAYTVAVTMLFFAFAKLMGVESTPSVTFGRYALIFAFGMVLSASEYVFSLDRLSRLLKHLIHYLVLAIAFFCVFLTVRSESDAFIFDAATIFASLIIFTAFYLVGFGIIIMFRHALHANDGRSVKQASKAQKKR